MRWISAIPIWMRGVAGVALLVAIVAGFKACTATTNHKTDAGLSAARNEGAATVRAEAAEEGLNDVVKGQAARAAVDRDARARYDVCVRTSRTPGNCRRPAS